jgi:hypothetical protein
MEGLQRELHSCLRQQMVAVPGHKFRSGRDRVALLVIGRYFDQAATDRIGAGKIVEIIRRGVLSIERRQMQEWIRSE